MSLQDKRLAIAKDRQASESHISKTRKVLDDKLAQVAKLEEQLAARKLECTQLQSGFDDALAKHAVLVKQHVEVDEQWRESLLHKPATEEVPTAAAHPGVQPPAVVQVVPEDMELDGTVAEEFWASCEKDGLSKETFKKAQVQLKRFHELLAAKEAAAAEASKEDDKGKKKQRTAGANAPGATGSAIGPKPNEQADGSSTGQLQQQG